jgi:hypothetical protein
MKGYITKRPNGLYLVTKFKPIITEIKLTNKLDAYIVYGDPVGFLNVSQEFVNSVYDNVNLEVLNTHRMRLTSYGNYTHWLLRQTNGLYQIRQMNDVSNYIINICPWFAKIMFNIEDLSLKEIKLIHFSGELYG